MLCYPGTHSQSRHITLGKEDLCSNSRVVYMGSAMGKTSPVGRSSTVLPEVTALIWNKQHTPHAESLLRIKVILVEGNSEEAGSERHKQNVRLPEV